MNYPNYAPNFGVSQNYGQPQYVQPQMPQPQPPIQPVQPTTQNVNKLYVTSLEDALARYANSNTIIVYHLQDESAEIEVATDSFGKKNYRIRKLVDYTPEEAQAGQKTAYVTIEQAKALEDRIKALEEQAKKAEVNDIE